MACCKERIIQHIIRQFSISSPCAEQMCCVIPAFWDMVSAEACGSCHLTALLTKREAVLFLLGCEAYSVDLEESHYTMIAEAKADSRSDSRTQAQSTGSMNKKMEAHGETTYSEKSEANSVYNSVRVGRAEENTDGDSFYRDDGQGFGFNRSESFSFLRNRIDHVSAVDTDGHSTDKRTGNDCNYEYSQNNTNGWGINAVFISTAFSGTASEWRKYQRSVSEVHGESRSITSGVAVENDTGLSTSRGTHRWEDTFLADIEWYEQEHIVRFHNERFDSRKKATAHSDGSGDGMHEQKDESHSASQGTSQTVGDSETLRTATRVSNLDAFSLTNSQRFLNLQNLYDQITEQINHVRDRLRARSRPLVDVMPCCCKAQCCCGPQLRKRGLDVLMSLCGTTACAGKSSMLQYPRIM